MSPLDRYIGIRECERQRKCGDMVRPLKYDNPELIEKIRRLAGLPEFLSIRQIELRTGVPKSSVHRILNAED